MKPINVTINEKKNGFHMPSEYTRARLAEWMKKYQWFSIQPIISDSVKKRRYLEGAVIPEYCLFQYGIDPKDPEKDDARRYLFKRDFNYEILKDRNGMPERIPLSTRGKTSALLTTWTQWAEQNGCPIPNADLYKLYRDQWSMDYRFSSYSDFLQYLGISCDAMPSNETLSKLVK